MRNNERVDTASSPAPRTAYRSSTIVMHRSKTAVLPILAHRRAALRSSFSWQGSDKCTPNKGQAKQYTQSDLLRSAPEFSAKRVVPVWKQHVVFAGEQKRRPSCAVTPAQWALRKGPRRPQKNPLPFPVPLSEVQRVKGRKGVCRPSAGRRLPIFAAVRLPQSASRKTLPQKTGMRPRFSRSEKVPQNE